MNIIGAGGFAREIAAHFYRSLNAEPVFWVETNWMADGLRDLNNITKRGYAILAVGDPILKRRLVEAYCKGVSFPSLNDGTSYSPLAEGVIVCKGAIVTIGVKFGKHVHLNLNVTVGHDCCIGDYTTINPGVNISGAVTIGAMCNIGTGASIREKIIIASGVTIGAGGVVVKNITEPGTYVGVPVRRIK